MRRDAILFGRFCILYARQIGSAGSDWISLSCAYDGSEGLHTCRRGSSRGAHRCSRVFRSRMSGELPGIANSAAMESIRRRSKSRTHHALRRRGSLLPLRQVLLVSPDGQPTSGVIVRPLERFRHVESCGVFAGSGHLWAGGLFCVANQPSAKVRCPVMGQVGTFRPTRSYCDRFALQKAQHGLAGMGYFANQLRWLCNSVKRGATSISRSADLNIDQCRRPANSQFRIVGKN